MFSRLPVTEFALQLLCEYIITFRTSQVAIFPWVCEKVSRVRCAPFVCQMEGHLSGKIAHLTCLYTGNGGQNAHYWLAGQTKSEMKPYARMFFTSNLLILLQIVALCAGKTTSRLPERFNSGNFLAHPDDLQFHNLPRLSTQDKMIVAQFCFWMQSGHRNRLAYLAGCPNGFARIVLHPHNPRVLFMKATIAPFLR